ncbi:hypothetical protein ACEQ8H_000583 [Pleosporales sp. CAS-2024a]
MLEKIDRHFVLERTYPYTPEEIHKTMVKLQKALGFSQTEWHETDVIREEMNVERDEEAYRRIADKIVENAIEGGSSTAPVFEFLTYGPLRNILAPGDGANATER